MLRKKKTSTKQSKLALIVGATSSIAVAVAEEMARQGWRLILAARDHQEAANIAHDLQIRHGNEAKTVLMDISNPDMFSAEGLIDQCESFGELDVVLIAAGTMGDEKNPDSADNIEHVVQVNFTAPAQIMAAAARRMLTRQKRGDIVVISSVAGDRGRATNFAYGSAKAGISAFASGLRNKLSRTQVHVMTIKPGFVDTPMTYGMKSPLIADRKLVAKLIMRGIENRRNVIYVPAIWWLIMLIINHIPEFIFKRMRI